MTDGNVSCPSCKATSRYNLVEVWNEYKLFECSLCLVQFWYPTKHPGSKYYENNLLYTLFDMDYNLSWYHKQFMKDKPGLRENKRRLIDVGCGNGKFIY
ncbi:MAG: hypothetical protein N2254_09875, partial [bacterium]|nr:hypothetical protein [bacterium]